jgi:hypothetical protein
VSEAAIEAARTSRPSTGLGVVDGQRNTSTSSSTTGAAPAHRRAGDVASILAKLAVHTAVQALVVAWRMASWVSRDPA